MNITERFTLTYKIETYLPETAPPDAKVFTWNIEQQFSFE
jgi:hypothetical protein